MTELFPTGDHPHRMLWLAGCSVPGIAPYACCNLLISRLISSQIAPEASFVLNAFCISFGIIKPLNNGDHKFSSKDLG